MPATIDSIVTELAQLPDDRPPNGRMPAAMFGDAIKRRVQTRQTALAETAALHAERATNERECGSTHAGLGGHDTNTGHEGSSGRSVDDDEQDVDDETLKRLDPRSHIGAIAERMPSLHLIAFAVRCCTHRYVLSVSFQLALEGHGPHPASHVGGTERPSEFRPFRHRLRGDAGSNGAARAPR